jgi:hypothetical protein
MNRDEMLTVLHSLKLGVELTALTTEEALDCTYVTSKGVFHEWRALHDWPYYTLNITDCEKLLETKKKVKQHTLTFEDLEDTELKNLYSSEMGEDFDSVNMFFANIDNISCCDDGKLYVSVDDDIAYFFETYSAFEKAFEKRLILNILWEDMSDDELAEWVERVTHEELTFQFAEFEE